MERQRLGKGMKWDGYKVDTDRGRVLMERQGRMDGLVSRKTLPAKITVKSYSNWSWMHWCSALVSTEINFFRLLEVSPMVPSNGN